MQSIIHGSAPKKRSPTEKKPCSTWSLPCFIWLWRSLILGSPSATEANWNAFPFQREGVPLSLLAQSTLASLNVEGNRALSHKEMMILQAAVNLTPHGSVSAIVKRIEATTGQRMALATAYYTIQRLLDARLLSQRQIESTPIAGGRGKAVFVVTELGKQELARAFQTLDSLRISTGRPRETMA